jgi:hypothetical protein
MGHTNYPGGRENARPTAERPPYTPCFTSLGHCVSVHQLTQLAPTPTVIILGCVPLGDEVVIANLPQGLDVLVALATVAADKRHSVHALVIRLFLGHSTPPSTTPTTEPTTHQRISRQVLQTFGWPGQRYSDENNSKKPRKNNKAGPYAHPQQTWQAIT